VNIRELSYFRVLAEELNIGRASDRLAITQPGLSIALKRLEDHYSVALFERLPRGLALTDAGHLLLTHANRLIGVNNVAEQEMRAIAKGELGTLRLGVGITIADTLLPRVIGALIHEWPDVTLEITADLLRPLLELLTKGEIEAVLATLIEVDDPELTQVPLGEDAFVVTARKGHTRAKKLKSVAQIAAEKWVGTRSPTGADTWIENVFVNAHVPAPQFAVKANNTHVVLGVVASSDVLAFVPRSAINLEPWRSKLVELPIEAAVWNRQIGLTMRATNQSPLLQRFAQHVKKDLKKT